MKIIWLGKGGMLWKELKAVLNNMLRGRACRDVLVIHLGDNDLVREKGLAMIKAMKVDLKEINRKWAGTFVIWSEWIARREARGAVKPAAIDKVRRKVNNEMRGFCRENNFGRIAHPELRYEEARFFRTDGVHLSTIGMEMYILQIKEVVAGALGVKL